MPAYIEIICSCGRTLRVQADQAGASVRCWSCHAEHLVPLPRTAQRLARELGDCTRAFGHVEAYGPFFLLGLLLTGSLLIPGVGPGVAFGLLVVGAMRYCTRVRRAAPQGAEAPGRPGPIERLALLVLGVVGALGLVAPLLLVYDAAPRLIRPGPRAPGLIAAVALASWSLTPLLLLLASAGGRRGPLGYGRVLAALCRHPVATLASLLLVPAGLIALEAALVGVALQQDWLRSLLLSLDAFAPSGTRSKAFVDSILALRDASGATIFRNYCDHGLRRGHALVEVVPLSLGKRLDFPIFFNPALTTPLFLAIRVGLTLLITTALSGLLALQAIWFGHIVTVDHRAIARVPGPSPVPAPAAS